MAWKDFSAKRFLTCLVVLAFCFYIKTLKGYEQPDSERVFEKYGRTYSICFYTFKTLCTICTAIFAYFNLITSFFSSNDKVKTRENSGKQLSKTICFRVVTRGTFPDLVKTNLDINMSILKQYPGLKYTYEIVTDISIGLGNVKKSHVYEVVVPNGYVTKNNARYKARALQYAIESNVSRLEDEDLIVHLDEESLLTKSCVDGIIDFGKANKHHIGQGWVFSRCL